MKAILDGLVGQNVDVHYIYTIYGNGEQRDGCKVIFSGPLKNAKAATGYEAYSVYWESAATCKKWPRRIDGNEVIFRPQDVESIEIGGIHAFIKLKEKK
jgi:hypothetical protein